MEQPNQQKGASGLPADSQDYHIPVLLSETLEGLNIQPDGIYVDCTFGGGGHSRAILSRLGAKGKLVAFDQDDDAKKNLPDDERLIFVSHNFRHLQRFLRLEQITAVDGIMADLGVSSHQFDEAERGFSTRFNAALDMRMDQRQSLTAFDVVSTYTEQQLHKLFEQYGEVTNSKTLARKIADVRHTASLKTIDGFKNAVRDVVKGNPNKYFAQVFQALRIEVNDELGALKAMLEQIPNLLKPGGRVAIITFHSLEDRLVKHFFKRGSFDEPEENPFTTTVNESVLKIITKKPIGPSEEEMKRNPRSRSAKLRVAEKTGK
ncbi:MAG: 16S rRNA (cytosine(1402)-N(4))-methyltransferase RsmH [Chitinophagales bacterium]|nr:16S rRNA (cytosine(1402)-N(4))-methyltransferase RsmH [Chitinophagales bacterium]